MRRIAIALLACISHGLADEAREEWRKTLAEIRERGTGQAAKESAACRFCHLHRPRSGATLRLTLRRCAAA